MINCFEEKIIKNRNLPVSWQSNNIQSEIERFLQLNWEQRRSFYNDEKVESKQQFLDFKSNGDLRTNNYIGTIVFKDEQLNIFPKIFRTDIDDDNTDDLTLDHLMKNLVNWIEYCNKIEYPYITIKAELENCNNLKELFVTVFSKYVLSTLEKISYHQYIEKEEDVSTIKGKFDIKDYYCKKIFSGNLTKFNCVYSEFEFDNLLNQIIKYTCKILLNNVVPSNQKRLRDILIKLKDVSNVICVPTDCDKIKISKMNYHYKIIVSMCKVFLLNKNSNFNVDNTESFCFLFPSELLFEGFIGGYIQSLLGKGSVKLQASDEYIFDDVVLDGVSLGKKFRMRHDIVIEKNNKIFILDTKYKQVPRFSENNVNYILENVSENDIYQVSYYALSRGIEEAYLLYPMYRMEEFENKLITTSKSIKYDGTNRIVKIKFLRIPFVFEDNIDEIKENINKVITNILR